MGVSTTPVAEASAKILASIRENNSRLIPTVEPYHLEQINRRIHVYSVSIWKWNVPFGVWGNLIIPACENSDYVEFKWTLDPDHPSLNGKGPQAIPGIIMQPRIMDAEEMVWHIEDGRTWANMLVSPYIKYGVFVAAGDKPAKDELSQARENMRGAALAFVEQARELAADPFQRKNISYEKHHKSAAYLGLDEKWSNASDIKDRQRCPMCGDSVDADVMGCFKHNPPHIFDIAGYTLLLDQQNAALKRVAH